MTADEVWKSLLIDLGAYLQSEKSVAITEFSERDELIRHFYLYLWKLSNAVDQIVGLASLDAATDPSSETIAKAIEQLFACLAAPGSSQVALDLCRSIYEPDAIYFAGRHRSSYADTLLELAVLIAKALVAAGDPDDLETAEQDCINHPQGHLHLKCDPEKVVAHWNEAELLIWNCIIRGWSGLSSDGEPNVDDDGQDGPYGINQWRYNGKVLDGEMTSKPHQLASYLFERLGRKVTISDLLGTNAIFENVANTTVQRHGSNISKWFVDHSVPLIVESGHGYIWMKKA